MKKRKCVRTNIISWSSFVVSFLYTLAHSIFFSYWIFSSLFKEMVSDFHDTTCVPMFWKASLIPTHAQEWFVRHTLTLALLLLPLSWNFPSRLTFHLFSVYLSKQARILMTGTMSSPTSCFPPSLAAPVSSTHKLLLLFFDYFYPPFKE